MKRISSSFCVLAFLSVALVACGEDGAKSGERVVTETTTATSITTPPTTVDSTTPTTIADDGVVRISVTVGVDSGPDRVEEVSVGASVELTIVNPDDDDEFHVHGFDLGGEETPAGEEKVFAFTATEAGDFEVESHVSGEVLVVIRVS